VVKELASLKSLLGTTTGEDLFLSVCETMKELQLPWTKLTYKLFFGKNLNYGLEMVVA
jgi:hypothetical protein